MIFRIIILLGLLSLSAVYAEEPTSVYIHGETYGAQGDEVGPIGGGAGYKRIVTKGDYTVENLDQLIDALAKAKAGQTIFIPGETEIDCTARVYIEELVLVIPAGVTLAGNRGQDGSKGALLCSDAIKTPTLIRLDGPDARISGLRIQGPNPKCYKDHHRRSFAEGHGEDYYYKLPTSRGITTEYAGLEVDNCDLWGWSYAAVSLQQGDRHHIHHNYIHHCQYNGLGYGVCHDRAISLTERNLFNYNRHSIAGTGNLPCGYEARHNVELGFSNGHCCDMHGGGGQRKDGTAIAGSKIIIHHNTFRATYKTMIAIRGVPEESCDIYLNWFLNHADPKAAVGFGEKTRVHNNAYGKDSPQVIY